MRRPARQGKSVKIERCFQRDTKKAFAVLKMLGEEAVEMKKLGKKVEPHQGEIYKKLRADMNVEDAVLENKWWKGV